MTRALVTSSKYSPGNMTSEALAASFVGREKTLSDVLKRIAASAMGREKHYILLIGPRGVGKTHFVALLHHRLVTDPAYETARARLRIAYLNEEEWGVASFLDLLVRILRALASRDDALDAKIEQVYAAHEKDPALALEVAQSILIEHIGKRTLLLLCENLVDLFDGLGDEGQKRWRAFMQEHPFWTILATTPAMFAGVQLQTSPFYGFFTVRHLEKLDFETALSLLRKKAEIEKRTDLADALGTPTGRARVRAIHHLAGGNHRVYVTMFDFLDRESLDDLVTPFMEMVDDLTPYYQDRMRQLTAPQQRKIAEFLSRHEVPAMVKDVARRCLISPQTAAKQLGELAKLGFVRSIKSGRATYYELAEPLMRICVEVKDNKTQHLRLFVRLLREWFTARELKSRLDEVCHGGGTEHHIDRIHIEIALREYTSLDDEPLLRVLDEEVARCIKSRDYAGMADASLRLADERGHEMDYIRCIYSLRELGRFEDARTQALIALGRYPQSHRIAFEYACALKLIGHLDQALVEIDRAIKLDPNGIYYCFRGGLLMDMRRYDDVIANENVALRIEPGHTHSLLQKAKAFLAMGRAAEAESAARALAGHKGYAAVAWPLISRALFQQRKYKASLASTRQASRLDPNDIHHICNQGVMLRLLGRYEACVANQDRVLAIDPTHSHAVYVKAMALVDLRRFDEAERLAVEYVQREPRDPDGLFITCLAKAGLREFKNGAEYLATSLATFKQSDDWMAEPEFEPAKVAAGMMWIEAFERSPLMMAERVAAARRALGKPGLDELFADALVELLRSLAGGDLLQAKSWEQAIPALSAALSDLPDCEVPLKMLSAAVRYSGSHDEADLLDLPLEQRTLLLDAFAEKLDTAPA